MAAARLRQHVNNLFLEVRYARARWIQYLQAVDVETRALQPFTKGQPAPERYENLEAGLAALERRQQILFDLNATELHEFGSAAGLIATAPLQRRGLDTQLSFFHDVLNLTEIAAGIFRAELGVGEAFITARFEQLKNNYDEVLRFFNEYSVRYDHSLVLLDLYDYVDQSIHYAGAEVEDIEAKFGLFEEGKGDLYKLVRIVDRQVLQFEKNLEIVGISVPRQTMITEYMSV